MATFVVTVGDAPYGRQRMYTALRFSLAVLAEGHSINLFLFEDAIWAAKKGQNPPEFPGLLEERMPNCEELMRAVIKEGGSIKTCGVCSNERALTSGELIEKIQIGSMRDLIEWVEQADKIINF